MTYCTRELREQGVPEERIELRQLRRRLKLTQAEAAKQIGVNTATWVRYELHVIQNKRHRRTQRAVERWREQAKAKLAAAAAQAKG